MNRCQKCEHWVHDGQSLVCTTCGTPKGPNTMTSESKFTSEEVNKFNARQMNELEEERYQQWKADSTLHQKTPLTKKSNTSPLFKKSINSPSRFTWIFVFGFALALVFLAQALFQNQSSTSNEKINNQNSSSEFESIKSNAYLIGYNGNIGSILYVVELADSRRIYCESLLGLHPEFSAADEKEYVEGCLDVLEDTFGFE